MFVGAQCVGATSGLCPFEGTGSATRHQEQSSCGANHTHWVCMHLPSCVHTARAQRTN